MSGVRGGGIGLGLRQSGLRLADEGQHTAAEVPDLLVVVREAEQDGEAAVRQMVGGGAEFGAEKAAVFPRGKFTRERAACAKGALPSGPSGFAATEGAGDTREIDVASSREIRSLLHGADRGSRRSGPSRNGNPVSYPGPANFMKA